MTGRTEELREGMAAAMAAAVMALALNGCVLHRRVQPFAMPPFTPVELAQVPGPAELPMVAADDEEEDLPPVPVAEGAAEPKRQRRKPVKAAVPSAPPETPPAQVAETVVTPAESASVIGEFTPGGDQDPNTQKEATDLISANEKRLNALSPEVTRVQATLVGHARNFQRQAQQALKAGDAAGAKTLATKGKLLLDDVEKAAEL